MALIGSTESNFGAGATYHMIKNFNWCKGKSIDICVHSFVDQVARIADKSPLLVRTYSIDNSLSLDTITLTNLYDALKLKGDFIGMING